MGNLLLNCIIFVCSSFLFLSFSSLFNFSFLSYLSLFLEYFIYYSSQFLSFFSFFLIVFILSYYSVSSFLCLFLRHVISQFFFVSFIPRLSLFVPYLCLSFSVFHFQISQLSCFSHYLLVYFYLLILCHSISASHSSPC